MKTKSKKALDPMIALEEYKSTTARTKPVLDLENERERVLVEATANLWSAMRANGITNAELARRLDVTPSHVSHILAGRRDLRLGTLADAFGAMGYRMRVTFDAGRDGPDVIGDAPPPVEGRKSAHGFVVSEKGGVYEVRTVKKSKPKSTADLDKRVRVKVRKRSKK
jgi:transcriptional regulator with XRE-family HTH domain